MTTDAERLAAIKRHLNEPDDIRCFTPAECRLILAQLEAERARAERLEEALLAVAGGFADTIDRARKALAP